MPHITPHLWYDKEAGEAARFYTSCFNDARIKNAVTLHDTPSGSAELITIELLGRDFMLISAGPYFRFTPAVSFLVACTTREEVDTLWKKLSPGGSALMELGEYPFSERYGWLQDKYGLSWQVMHMGNRDIASRIIPTLMFTGDRCGKAEEAITFYTSVFRNGKVGNILRYNEGEGSDRAGTVKHASFRLLGQDFAAMDSAYGHGFTFTEAHSFIVQCETQEEIDYFWGKLSAVPAAEQCGWLKDNYGVSWQIVPTAMSEMLKEKDPAKIARVTKAFLGMKKFNIAQLREAFEGRASLT
jgi:predicted 3-demethylubiquinone-9 3-methyltransferase (glyoxalase superfamily)